MQYSYSMLEKALLYGPQFVAALGAILIFAAAVFQEGAAGFLRDKIYKIAAAVIFVSCAFLFLYATKTPDLIHGVIILKSRALLLALGACFFIMATAAGREESGIQIMCLAALASMHAAFTAENPMLVFAAFIVMDSAIFAALLLKKENAEYAAGLMPAKLVFAAACAVFAALFMAFPSGKTAKMAGAGSVIFMMLFSNPGLLALRGNDTEEGGEFLNKNPGFILFSGIITAIIASDFMPAAAPRPVMIAAVILACVNIYRTITEEKYGVFAAHDSINPLFLLAALACGSGLPSSGLVFPAVLFMLSAFLQNEFISAHDHGNRTVASVKYGFDKIKGGGLALFGVLSGLAAEIWVFALFYKHVKQDPFIFAAIIFLALAFFVPMLNKLFMAFSMLKRLKVDLSPGAIFKKGNLRPAIFVLFTAALMAGWLK